jgi:hypothetical protein
MDAHVVYSAGDWKKVSMDGNLCDRHPSAQAKARILFPNLSTLYLCGHCAKTLPITGEYTVTYETVTV